MRIYWILTVVSLACVGNLRGNRSIEAAEVVANTLRSEARQSSLANAFAGFVEQAIPREYEKRKDWDRTKNITVGLRNKGFKLYRRKKRVNHGTWKHYKVGFAEPHNKLDLKITNLHAAAAGRLGFTMKVTADFNLWSRIKVYQYGVHLIGLEVVGDAAIDLEIDGEIGIRLQTGTGQAGVALDPRVTAARLDITDLNLQRVSKANGFLVQELGEEFPRFIEQELHGAKLVAKLNRAIEKKRDRLELSVADLWK